MSNTVEPSAGTDASSHVDFLRLLDADLAGVSLVVVHGRSGTGKSTSLQHLLARHPRFAGQVYEVVRPAFRDPLPERSDRPVLVDEVLRPRDVATVGRLLGRGHVVMVASHVPPSLYAPFRLRWRMRTFSSNRDDGKLGWELDRLGVPYSSEALHRFRRRFGANFIDLRIVLERSPGRSLDAALAYFERTCRLETRRRERGTGGRSAVR